MEDLAILAAGAAFELFGGETVVLAFEIGAFICFLGGETDFLGSSVFTVLATVVDLVTFWSTTCLVADFLACCLGGDTFFLPATAFAGF